MKRRFLLAAILALSMGVCSLGLFACSKTATVSGTYYYYENGKYDGAMYIKFGATKWTDDEERNGDYKINGKNIVLYMGLESENNVFLSGTVKGDEVKLNVSGEQYVYKKNADLDILPEKSLVFEPNADKTAYTVTGIGELSGEIVVPDTYKKKPVVEIADNVFNKNDNITSVTIGNNVKSIGDYAFSWCSNLASVTIGNNVKSIGEDAFHGCSSLTRITIPDSVTSIGGYAFYNCRNLTSITIPESVTSIGWSAFYNCSSLTGITIGNGVTGIGPYAFENCSSLMGITIGSGVTSIGENAFYNCSELASITVDSDNPNFSSQDGILYNKAQTKFLHIPRALSGAVTIPQSITSIGNRAFYGRNNLTSLTLSDSIESVGHEAFLNCDNLQYNEYGNGCYLGNSGNPYVVLVKAKNTNIKSCTVNGGAKVVYENALSGCNGLTTISLPFVGANKNGTGDTHFGYIFGASRYDDNKSNVPASLKTVIITGGTRIAAYAFYGCSNLTDVSIPQSVTSIGGRAFEGCFGLKSITVDSGNTKYLSSGNCLIERETKTLISGCNSSVIPANGSVTRIEARAFAYCGGLTNITIPDSVTSIGYSAFKDCDALSEMSVPFVGANKDGTGDRYFGYIFGASKYSGNGSCVPHSLKTLIITGGTSIATNAFYQCSQLEKIMISDSITSIEFGAFFYCDGLKSITVDSGNTKYLSSGNCLIDRETKTLILGCKSSVIPANGSVTRIEESAFEHCSGLTSITVPDSVTSIGRYAFKDCDALSEISVPFVGAKRDNTDFLSEHFGYIFGARRYDDNKSNVPASLKTVIITGGTLIAAYAFWGCRSLTSIIIPSSVTDIGGGAFYSCSALTIYCEAQSKPSGWANNWNDSNCPVVWDYKNNQ